MAHTQDFGFGPTHGFLVEEQRTTMEPIRAWLFVVLEWQPQTLKLSDFLAMLAVPEIDHVGYA
jgi:hypothetical protein